MSPVDLPVNWMATPQTPAPEASPAPQPTLRRRRPRRRLLGVLFRLSLVLAVLVALLGALGMGFSTLLDAVWDRVSPFFPWTTSAILATWPDHRPDAWVVDPHQSLTPPERDHLAEQVEALSLAAQGPVRVVMLGPSEDTIGLSDLSLAVYRRWRMGEGGLGQRGVVLLVSPLRREAALALGSSFCTLRNTDWPAPSSCDLQTTAPASDWSGLLPGRTLFRRTVETRGLATAVEDLLVTIRQIL